VNLGENHPSPPNIRGPHVRISVIDTGHGMDTESLGLLFEPFFSTKERGIGLGLATVYGIVSQSGGHVEAESHPGAGATFAVYMPSVESPSM
jgi:signal transduction histidine kinase